MTPPNSSELPLKGVWPLICIILDLAAAVVGLCNMMLHMFHMTNYTIQKEEGRWNVRVRKRGGGKNNDGEGNKTGQDL